MCIDFLVGGVITKDTMEDDGQMNHWIDGIKVNDCLAGTDNSTVNSYQWLHAQGSCCCRWHLFVAIIPAGIMAAKMHY